MRESVGTDGIVRRAQDPSGLTSLRMTPVAAASLRHCKEEGDYYECRRRNVSRHFFAVSNSENLLPSCSTR